MQDKKMQANEGKQSSGDGLATAVKKPLGGDDKQSKATGQDNDEDGVISSNYEKSLVDNDEDRDNEELADEDLGDEDPVLDEEDLEENDLSDEEADNIEWDKEK
jgi:hypothetical protein